MLDFVSNPQPHADDRLLLLSRLKTATEDAHQRVERALPSLAQLATRDGYASLLRALYGFHAGWEPAVLSTIGASLGIDLGHRRKLPLLEHDLRFLGIPPARPVCPAPGGLDVPAAVGALYVLEGATLGGQVILRQAAPALEVGPERGASYLHGYGADTGPRWREFGSAAAAYSERTGMEDEIVTGAITCFEALERWIATCGVLGERAA